MYTHTYIHTYIHTYREREKPGRRQLPEADELGRGGRQRERGGQSASRTVSSHKFTQFLGRDRQWLSDASPSHFGTLRFGSVRTDYNAFRGGKETTKK